MVDFNSPTTSSSSPCSSESLFSDHGTPATKLTAFSPEDARDEPKVMANSSIKVHQPPSFTLQGVPIKCSLHGKAARSTNLGAQDPFTTMPSVVTIDGSSLAAPRLSPVANSFTPSAGAMRKLNSNGSEPPAAHTYHRPMGVDTVSYLTATSVPDTKWHGTVDKNPLSVLPDTLLSPIGPRAVPVSIGPAMIEDTLKTMNDCSRYLMISQVLKWTTPQELNEIFTVSSRFKMLEK